MRAQDVCARAFAQSHPEDAARLIERYSAAASVSFLEGLPAEAAAGVIERMSLAAGADCLSSMTAQHAATITAALPSQAAAALLRRLGDAHRDALLAALPEDARSAFTRLLTYAEDTVGSVTDLGVLALPQDLTVGEAVRQLRRHHEAAHHHVYVVDRAQQLVGVVHIRDLVSGRPGEVLADIMRPARSRLSASVRLASAAVLPVWRELDALPVIDDGGVLLGMVRYRQLRPFASPPGPGGLADTLLGLGELCWIGLATFLPLVPSAPMAPPPASGFSAGGETHG